MSFFNVPNANSNRVNVNLILVIIVFKFADVLIKLKKYETVIIDSCHNYVNWIKFAALLLWTLFTVREIN